MYVVLDVVLCDDDFVVFNDCIVGGVVLCSFIVVVEKGVCVVLLEGL